MLQAQRSGLILSFEAHPPKENKRSWRDRVILNKLITVLVVEGSKLALARGGNLNKSGLHKLYVFQHYPNRSEEPVSGSMLVTLD